LYSLYSWCRISVDNDRLCESISENTPIKCCKTKSGAQCRQRIVTVALAPVICVVVTDNADNGKLNSLNKVPEQ